MKALSFAITKNNSTSCLMKTFAKTKSSFFNTKRINKENQNTSNKHEKKKSFQLQIKNLLN